MEKELIRLVIGSIVFGLAKATHLKMTSGEVFKRPQIVPSPRSNSETFGVIDSEDPSYTRILYIEDVEMIY